MQKLFAEGQARTTSNAPPPPSDDEPREPHTLATLAAALVTCAHPGACQVGASIVFGGQPIRITWCAACGAITSDEQPATWTGSAISQLFLRQHFEELRQLVHGLGEIHRRIAAAGSSLVERGSPIDKALRGISKDVSELTSGPLVREIDCIDRAVAHLAPAGNSHG